MPSSSRLSLLVSPRRRLRSRARGRALLTSGVLVLLGTCAKPTPEQVADGADPLAALAAPVGSTRYTPAYWTEQFRADAAGRPAPWRQALADCGTGDPPRPGLAADGAKPNCAAVYQAYVRTAAAEAAQERGFDSTLQAAQARNRRLGF
ncbi:MAG TPA: hypothetical protein VGD56_08650 [Gemmatirosa sp.]